MSYIYDIKRSYIYTEQCMYKQFNVIAFFIRYLDLVLYILVLYKSILAQNLIHKMFILKLATLCSMSIF